MFDGGSVSMIGYNIGLSEARGERGEARGKERERREARSERGARREGQGRRTT
jgi:hypothetical protein